LEYKLIINGYTPPNVSKGGYSITLNRIWSSNTGRSATGKMYGDIIAEKYTLHLSWDKMKSKDVSNLANAITSKAFFNVTFVDEHGAEKTSEFYSADPTYLLDRISKVGVGIFNNIAIELIER
jgi:hypothetical protein